MIIIFKSIVGLIFGSFITLTSTRTIRHESIIHPRSHCDFCNHQLKPWELIPVISFLILRGKCSQCHHFIGFFTLIGELSGGLILIINPVTLLGIIEIIFELILLLIAERDYQEYQIPTWSVLILFTLTLIQKIFTNQFNLKITITIFIIYTIILALNHHLSFIGNGDIDLITILFLKLDLQPTLLIILLSSFLAIIKYLIHHNSHFIPYIPYLTVAYYIIHVI